MARCVCQASRRLPCRIPASVLDDPAPSRPGLVAVAEQSVLLALQIFEQEMRSWMDRFGVAKATLAVMREDRLVFARGYGGRHEGERVVVWSLSKAITAT
jgi:CubicO group peptidase (beta-lactamase class C family)